MKTLTRRTNFERVTITSGNTLKDVLAKFDAAVGDRMAIFLAPYENRAALKIARDLDAKAEALLASSA